MVLLLGYGTGGCAGRFCAVLLLLCCGESGKQGIGENTGTGDRSATDIFVGYRRGLDHFLEVESVLSMLVKHFRTLNVVPTFV